MLLHWRIFFFLKHIKLICLFIDCSSYWRLSKVHLLVWCFVWFCCRYSEDIYRDISPLISISLVVPLQVENYTGPAVVVVSCVTVDAPYRPHPHNLVGKDGCREGVCTVNINNDNMECVFSNLGIQCVKRKEVEQALKKRQDIRVDPFQSEL